MALTGREILLVVRAKDEASRVLATLSTRMGTLSTAQQTAIKKNLAVGSALVTAGAAITAVGAAGVAFYASATNAAIEYNRTVALTQTQLDKQHISFQQLFDLGLELARTLPVPFEQIQPMLYDIFSSMDVNLKGARTLLFSFGQAAVAGQVSLQEAGRATIGILNAYHLSASHVNEINDVMFQLVRKGVGTYGQFASVIGRAVPSAVRAGQSIQTLAGMMAFLTRNGLSTAMSAASAARALDALSNPKAVKNMEDLGVRVVDAHKRFLPLIDIIQQLHDKLGKLPNSVRAAKIQELFKGAGGTIQARRFLDVAIKDPSQLRALTASMGAPSRGSTATAFGIMSKQTSAQIQLLKNNLMVLKVTMGNILLPIINKVVGWLIKLFQWFEKLSPTTKKWITIIGAALAVLTVLIGIVTAVAGVFLILAGAVAILGAEFFIVVAIVALVVAAVAVLAFFIIKYHKQIWAFVTRIWNDIKDFVVRIWNDIYDWVANALSDIWNVIVNTWNAVASFFVTVWNAIVSFFQGIWNSSIVQFIIAVMALIVQIFRVYWLTVYRAIAIVVQMIWKVISTVISHIVGWLRDNWAKIYEIFIHPWLTVWGWIITHIPGWVKWINDNLIQPAINMFTTTWGLIKDLLIAPIKAAWDGITTWLGLIYSTFTQFLDNVRGVIDNITGFFKKLNPLSRSSPPLTDQTRWGWQKMEKTMFSSLDRIHHGVRKRTGLIRGSMNDTFAAFGNNFGDVNVGGFASPGYGAAQAMSWTQKHQKVIVNTQEIDPVYHAQQLGWELERRTG